MFEALAPLQSEFGRFIVRPNPDVLTPRLDPSVPIARSRIVQAAMQAGVPEDKIDETVASLSQFLGWDITKGLQLKD